MSLQIKPFLAIPGLTNAVTVGSSANTLTLGVNTTGLPLESIRIVNAGTAAIFVRPIASGNTTTVAITNSMPILSNATAIIATGGQPCIGYIAASTFTTTAYFTGGIGGGTGS
jgi:hypothetical protein